MTLYLNIKPNQRFNAIEQSGGKWTVRVKAPAIDGKANEAMILFLSEVLKVPRSKIVLRKGATSRLKCLDIDAVENVVLERLYAAASAQ